jgi:hypothetical protein
MKTISKYNNISPLLSASEVEIVRASYDLKIRDMSVKDLSAAISEIISRTFYEAGQKIERADLIMTTQLFEQDLRRIAPWVTVQEVCIAFREGVRGAYGQNFGLNVVSFSRWVEGYRNSQSRQESIKKQEKWLSADLEDSLTEDQKEQILISGLKSARKEYEENGTYFDIANVLYNYLDRKGEIKFTTEEKNEFISKAREILLNDIRIEAVSDPSERSRLRNLIERIKLDKDHSVISEAKRIAFVEHLSREKK